MQSTAPPLSWATPITLRTIHHSSPHHRFPSRLATRPSLGPTLPPSPSVLIPTCTTTHTKTSTNPSIDTSILKPQNPLHLGLITPPETTTPLTLEVEGSFPTYLANAAYYRNGPGVFEVTHKDGQMYTPHHWCDGIAMVHAFHFHLRDQTVAVTFQSRTIAQGTIRAIQSVPKEDYVGVCVSRPYQPKPFLATLRAMLLPMTKDPHTGQVPYNNAVSLEYLPGKGHLNARTDANSILRVHPRSLDVIEAFDFTHFSPKLRGTVSCAHGAYDEHTGEYFNFTYEPGFGKVGYKVFRIDAEGKGEIVTTFRDHPYYLHSIALTERYIIMVMWPCHLDILRLLRHHSFLDALKMKPDTPTNFVVISRSTNNIVATYQHDPFFSFHAFAAFEQDDDIIIDMPHYRNASIFASLSMDNLKAGVPGPVGAPVRYTLQNVTAAAARGPDYRPRVAFRKLANFGFEMASLTPLRQRKPYRYAYGITDSGFSSMCSVVSKLDTQHGQHMTWMARNSFVGEPLFVPDPEGREEDDGCLLVLGLDAVEEKSFLAVLDARDMTLMARAVVPLPLPHGLHGTFVPNVGTEEEAPGEDGGVVGAVF
eukprot:GFKZ01004173.1.p1 GENE.GFKZ01004173.1~~GFKZ01004173.1.p1  ORF type:complete len:592 (-),score=68.03 GFKZ01004173.1:685-2460(-)